MMMHKIFDYVPPIVIQSNVKLLFHFVGFFFLYYYPMKMLSLGLLRKRKLFLK